MLKLKYAEESLGFLGMLLKMQILSQGIQGGAQGFGNSQVIYAYTLRNKTVEEQCCLAFSLCV